MNDADIKYIKDVMQSANINFLIGSGLSQPYLKTLGNIEKYLTELSSRTNLEESVELLVKNSLLNLYFRDVMFNNICVVGTCASADKLITANNYSTFLKIFNSLLQRRGTTILNKRINVFTTNIDLFFEKTLDDLGLEFNDGFSGRLSPAFSLSNYNKVMSQKSLHFNNESKVPVFNLVKLHGSLNWKFDGNKRIVYTNDLTFLNELDLASNECEFVAIEVIDTIDTIIDKAQKKLLVDGNKNDKILLFQKKYEEIPVVNPTKAKFKETVLDLNYYELLRYYSNELEKENSVLFVMGFSMADEHIAEITLRLAKSNPTLTIIVFCYNESSKIEIHQNLKNTDQGNIKFFFPKDSDVFDFKTINDSIFNPILKKIEDDK